MSFLRTVQAELLDELPATDPDAIRSRRDLRRVNRWMGNPRALAEILSRNTPKKAPDVVVELGAGDGTLMLHVLRELEAQWPGGRIVLVDRQPAVTAETRQGYNDLGWEVEVATSDVVEWLTQTNGVKVDLMVANLFLHHFSEATLRKLLGQAAQQASLFAACEPRRSVLSLNAARLLWMIGCNAVTQHDAVVSVRAGFAGTELSNYWPAEENWRLEEKKAGLFSHAFVATRLPAKVKT